MNSERDQKIVGLLNELGALGCCWQDLDECMSNVQTGKKCTRVTFATTQMSPGEIVNGTARKGFVLWMPRREQPETPKTKEVERG